MKLAFVRFLGVVVIGCALGAAFSFAYPGLEIDKPLALLIALVAIVIETILAFAYRRLTNRA